MSYHRRQAQKQAAMLHEVYEAPSGNELALSSELDLSIQYMPEMPGPREVRYLDSSESWQRHIMGDNPDVRDRVDWAAGGQSGFGQNVGSSGVTDPQTVDRHDFQGDYAEIRRMADTNYGPVKTSDHNSILSLLALYQESSHYFPNEMSQQDLWKAV